MKNIKKALGIFFLFMITAGVLMGCTSDDNSDATTATTIGISQTVEENAEEIAQSEAANEEQYSYYPILDKIGKVEIGRAYEPENQIIFVLSDEERSDLWQLMLIDEWVVASDLPLDLSSSPSEFIIHENGINEEYGMPQSWAFREWDGQTLISPSLPDSDSKKICYFAPADILPNLISFTAALTPFSE